MSGKYTDRELDEYFDIIEDIVEGETEDIVAEIYDWDEAFGDAITEQDQAITDDEGSP